LARSPVVEQMLNMFTFNSCPGPPMLFILIQFELYRVAGQSTANDLKTAAEVCMPLIHAIMTEIKNGTYLKGSFLNVDVPTDAAHHKVK
jgi:hypothetical protein